MSLKPGAGALAELILQPEAWSQLLEMIPSGPLVSPPAAGSPRMPFPVGGWYGTAGMSSEAFFSLCFNYILGKNGELCNIYCSVHMEKEPSVILLQLQRSKVFLSSGQLMVQRSSTSEHIMNTTVSIWIGKKPPAPKEGVLMRSCISIMLLSKQPPAADGSLGRAGFMCPVL